MNKNSDLRKKMIDYAENGDKSIFANHPTAESVTDKCADVYYYNFEGLSDDLRKSISNYMLDNIFKQMVIPAIDEARSIKRENTETIKRLIDGIRTVNQSSYYIAENVDDDEPCYWQRKEWIEWVLELADEAEKANQP